MRPKIINFIVLGIFLTFSIFFGVTSYRQSVTNASQDNLFETELNSQLNDITKSISDEINITNTNKNNNNNSGTSSSPSAGDVEVSFTNFYEMYDYAVTKYNRATSIYSSATGTAYISGSAPSLNFTLDREKTVVNYIKAKNGNTRYFNFNLTGRAVVEGFGPLSINILQYTNGILYQTQIGTGDIDSYTENQYKTQFGWNMTDIFHLSNETLSNVITEEEIVSYYYDDKAQEYSAKISIKDPGSFQSNFGSVIKKLTDAPSVNFSKIEMTIKVDKYGNFKSISYADSFNATMSYKSIAMQGSIQTNFTETFLIIDNGYVNITNPFAA